MDALISRLADLGCTVACIVLFTNYLKERDVKIETALTEMRLAFQESREALHEILSKCSLCESYKKS